MAELAIRHPQVIHCSKQYENNRAEQSHEATRVRERGMRKFKSVVRAQRFVSAHAAVSLRVRPVVVSNFYQYSGGTWFGLSTIGI